MVVFLVLGLLLLSWVLPAVIFHKKGRPWFLGIVFALFLGPLAILVALFWPRGQRQPSSDPWIS